MGIASMVIGIFSLVIGFFPICGAWAIVPATVGLILGIVDFVQKNKRNEPKGTAIAGIVLNPAAIIVIISWIYFAYSMNNANMYWQPQRVPAMQQPQSIPTVPLTPPGLPSKSDPPMQPMRPVEPEPTPAPPDSPPPS